MKANLKKASTVTRRLTNLRMYGEIVGRRLGINIRPGNISTGCTDGKTVTINYAAFSEDPDAVVLLDGTCTHEFGHVRYTEFLAKKPILKRPVALSFYRSLEDARMEARQKREYPGAAVRIEAALEVMVGRGLFKHPENDEPVEALFPNTLLGWSRSQYLAQEILEPMYKARLALLCDQVGMAVIKGFLDIAKEGLDRARTTTDVVKCAIALEEYLMRELQAMESQQSQAGDGESGKDSEADSEPGSKELGDAGDDSEQDGQGSPQQDGSQGAGSPQGGQDNGEESSVSPSNEGEKDDNGSDAPGGDPSGDNDDSDASSEPGSKELGDADDDSEHDGQGSPQQDGSQGAGSPQGGQDNGEESSGNPGNLGDQDGNIPGAGTPSEDDGGDLDQAIRALAQLLGAGEDDLPETDLGNLLQEAIDQVAPAESVQEIRDKQPVANAAALEPYAALTRQIELRVASHLEVLLEARLEERSQIERAGRKLSSRHLARVQTSPLPRVFRVTEEIEGVSTAVSVLLDVSASMDESLADGFSRLHAAVASARAAVSAMDRQEVPCSLHFFGEALTSVKQFEEPWRRVRDLHWSRTEYGTLTGHAVERVVPVLATREEDRKLLLLVTDGYPEEPERTAAALQTCASFGVETAILLINSGGGASLAMFTDLLDSFGLEWIEVNTTDQLAGGLMQAIRNAV